MTSLACFLLGHTYLPERKMVKHHDGTEKKVDYLKCSRCGREYYFIFHNYCHLRRETDMWLAANIRALSQQSAEV